MRKLIASILILLLAFNWYGYRLLLQVLENNTNVVLQTKLDKQQYDPQELIEFRVTLNLPYLSDWKDFENCQGETIINGSHYRFVKRKLVNNELILVCIRDSEKDRLQNVGTEFFKQVNDTQGAEKKSKTPLKMVKGLTTEFTCTHIEPLNNSYCEEPDQYPIFHEAFTSAFISTPAQPPNS